MPPADRRAPQRAAEAVEGRIAARGVLEALEVRQHLGIAPAVVAECPPAIVVLALAANRNQPIDRAGSAERLPARPVDPAVVHSGLRLGVKAPVDAGIEHRLGIADRDVDPRVRVARTGFEQQHGMPAVSREAIGEDATGGASADDDVVRRERGHGGPGGMRSAREKGPKAGSLANRTPHGAHDLPF